MAVDEDQRSQQETDDEFNRIVANNFDPDQDAIQRGFDERFNGIAKNLRDQEERPSGVTADLDQAESYANDPNNATKSVDNAKQREEDGGWRNKTSGADEGKTEPGKGKSKGKKKKGPLAFLLGGTVVSGGIISILFSPGMLIVNFKEKLVEKFNDQLTAMDVRTTVLLNKKFKGVTSGICTSKVSVRCKFETISDRHLKKLEESFAREGGKVNSEKTLIGRNKITTVEFKGQVIDARNFKQIINGDPLFKSTWLRGYNPKLAGFADHIYMKLAKKIGLLKQKNVNGLTREEMRQSVVEAASGAAAAEADVRVSSKEEACDGGEGCVDGKRTVYVDDVTGETISKEEYDNRIGNADTLRAELDARKTLNETGGTVAKATLKGALTSTALGLGAVDSACTAYILIRAVGFAAKYIGMMQLVRFYHSIMNTADAIKASYVPAGATPVAAQAAATESTATIEPEQVSYVGDLLTSPNSEGQTATDGYGYQWAAYDNASGMPRTDGIQAQTVGPNGTNISLGAEQQKQVELNDEVTKYVNGQLVTDNVLSNVISLVDGGGGTTDTADEVCNFVKSGWGQAIVIGASLVGAVVAFFSGGVSLGWGAAVQAGVSVSISVAMAMLQPKLVDMAAGTMIGEPELGNKNRPPNSNRVGNAAVSGGSGYNHETAQARGIPVLRMEDVANYEPQLVEVQSQYAAVDRITHSPFDATNPNTFLGSIVSTMMPYASKFSSLSGSITGVAQMTLGTFGSLIPNATAQDPTAQFKICQDADNKKYNIAAGPFCSPVHGFNSKALAVDPDTVAAYMEKGYANPETGEPADSENEYGKYIKNCMDRSTAIGAFTEDNDNTGEECIQGSASRNFADEGGVLAKACEKKVTLATTAAAKEDCVKEVRAANANPATNPTCSSGDAAGDTECRRTMFRVYYLDLSVQEGMDNGEVASNASSKPGAVSGDAKQLAAQVANNPNIVFVDSSSKEMLLKFSRGEEIKNACDETMTISKYLLGALQANSTKYKVLVNNIGFKEDRSLRECLNSGYQHPKGTAVDLNNIEIIGGASTGGSIRLPGSGLAVVNQYASDFLAALPLNRGGVGQKNCGVNPVFPQGSVALNGSHLFEDACNHLHIDARNRENLADRE